MDFWILWWFRLLVLRSPTNLTKPEIFPNLKKVHRFKDLEIWKKSRIFCTAIYKVTSGFPDEEKFGLTNQIRRASVSIISNIAEGCSRKSNKDFSRFLEIAIGSMYEIETQLLISNDVGFLSNKDLETLQKQLGSIIKMTSKFKSTLNWINRISKNRKIQRLKDPIPPICRSFMRITT